MYEPTETDLSEMFGVLAALPDDHEYRTDMVAISKVPERRAVVLAQLAEGDEADTIREAYKAIIEQLGWDVNVIKVKGT